MLNLKKTAVAVLAFSSGAVFAGTMGPVCSAVNVTVPCETTAWGVGARALYLQSNFTAGNVALDRKFASGLTGTSINEGLNPKYGWGFMIEGSYLFNTGNDVNINWYHINNGRSRTNLTTRTLTGNNIFASHFPVATGGTASTTFTGTSASVSPQWDAVNIEFGQHVDFGENKSIRFHGGFEFARLSSKSTLGMSGSHTTTAGATSTFNTFVSNSPTYNGFGPRLGMDMNYDWGNGLGVYANGAAGLLAGSGKFSTTYTDNLSTVSETVSGSVATVVPELEGKLGVNYTYAMAQGDLTLDVGWMWINYFNVVRAESDVLNASSGQTGDFGLQGLYFGLKWLGNVA